MDTTSTNIPSTKSVDEDPLDAYMAEFHKKRELEQRTKKLVLL
ncbi:unnamed protein product [Meloidogyne enterolobii]|uniref:Uncharacterized protein n=2 Tax=Meloidogyne enterolobii TaxID=390850 RepID=A0ACB1AW19_MELEN